MNIEELDHKSLEKLRKEYKEAFQEVKDVLENCKEKINGMRAFIEHLFPKLSDSGKESDI